MDTAKLVTHCLLIFGLSCASLYLISNFTIAPASLFMSLHSSLPAIRSMCVEYLCYTWSLLSRGLQDHSRGPLLTPRNLFLLVNLIILFILTSLHLQHHAATGKRRKRRRQHTEILISDQQVLLQGSSLARLTGQGAATAAMARAASPSSLQQVEGREENSDDQRLASKSAVTEARDSMESLINEGAIPKEESLSYKPAELAASMEIIAADETESSSDHVTSGSLVIGEGSPTVDCDGINGPDVEKIVLEEDGRLRLIEGPLPLSKTTSHTSHTEDRESTNGSDAEKIVLEEDGRLRLIDRPLPSSRCRPEKSHSTPDPGDNYNHNDNYDSDNNSGINHNNRSFNDNNSGINHNNRSFNDNKSNLREINYGDMNHVHSQNHRLIKDDLSHDHSHNHSLIKGDLSHDRQQLQQQEAHGKSSSVLGNISRPRKKKSDSMDATWRAINDSRGSAINASRDPRRMISRQNSRHGFKPKARPPVRREPSISQEELNAKVESFIERFNEQIRIQRQQSLLSYMQMVDRGA